MLTEARAMLFTQKIRKLSALSGVVQHRFPMWQCEGFRLDCRATRSVNGGTPHRSERTSRAVPEKQRGKVIRFLQFPSAHLHGCLNPDEEESRSSSNTAFEITLQLNSQVWLVRMCWLRGTERELLFLNQLFLLSKADGLMVIYNALAVNQAHRLYLTELSLKYGVKALCLWNIPLSLLQKCVFKSVCPLWIMKDQSSAIRMLWSLCKSWRFRADMPEVWVKFCAVN